MKKIIINFFSTKMYLKYNIISKKFFKYRHLDFNIFLELLNKEKKGNIFFLQIGASDGVTNDPIYYLVKKYGWSGTLVEPLPHIFEQLKKNYESCKGLQFLNVAVSGESGSIDIFYLPQQHVQEEWQKQLASFDRKAIEFNLRHHPELAKKIELIKVPTADLKTIFSGMKQSKPDLLVIDVEGHEFQILKQLKDISNKPDYIFFEKGTMHEDELSSLHSFLVESNYKIYSCGPDDLAVRLSQH